MKVKTHPIWHNMCSTNQSQPHPNLNQWTVKSLSVYGVTFSSFTLLQKIIKASFCVPIRTFSINVSTVWLYFPTKESSGLSNLNQILVVSLWKIWPMNRKGAPKKFLCQNGTCFLSQVEVLLDKLPTRTPITLNQQGLHETEGEVVCSAGAQEMDTCGCLS